MVSRPATAAASFLPAFRELLASRSIYGKIHVFLAMVRSLFLMSSTFSATIISHTAIPPVTPLQIPKLTMMSGRRHKRHEQSFTLTNIALPFMVFIYFF
jgi:hypothetical protein